MDESPCLEKGFVQKPKEFKSLMNLAERMPVDIEFHDLCYTIPQGRKDEKRILKCISGSFKAGQLHAIMGPSGAGKSTLLNILATYRLSGSTGNVLVNGEPRNVRNFRKISRYIMQQDALQPLLTVQEIMTIAADLKLAKDITSEEKQLAIDDILDTLRLTKTKNTITNLLSGGEQKRLSIALELLNNPPVIFLDEPTTGLDDLSSSQCIQLLKSLAEGGRTIICSIHTPSAKIFSTFDNVYILADGHCVYQGYGPEVVGYLDNVGLPCPKHYNPADFIIEVCSGDYGDYQDILVSQVENGQCNSYYKRNILDEQIKSKERYVSEETIQSENASSLAQFKIILFRMWLQMYRDKTYLLLRFVVTLAIGLLIGNIFLGMGQDGSKTIFNFGFYYTCIIKFLYIPMMPVLLSFPVEIKLLKREFFNKWYRLVPYFFALTLSTIPITLILGVIYVSLVYFLTDQPFEWYRIIQFYAVCMMTALISESMGLLISSTFNILNGMFLGPVLAVPLMLLAVYGMGYEDETPIPIILKIAMHFSFLRYSLHGITTTMMKNRAILPCPEDEIICKFRDLDEFAKFMGLSHGIYWLDLFALILIFVIFRCSCFYLLKQRLRPNKAFRTIHFLLKSLKLQFNLPI
ncbi:PREDICTED: ATP-binding cassette sub-family G member 1-like isoform X2 [Nicrophorus vespilloides]|uniref:ATP-binding cassette sub-family G member 1-like isoform X2 n=1 Tax=Nicrophorus vespilloides TaxID=110193 RepID=A0ABM1MEK5_NICVS|nr:PREDICTED: ATP-binding cassette sub-family G member 1-like isoform X2 [Nicrophorus vespilloides]